MYSQQAHIRPHAPYRANTDDHNPYKDLYPSGQFLAPPTPQLGYQHSNEYSPASQKSDPLISYQKSSPSRRTLYKRGLWIGIGGLVLALVIALPLGLQHRFDNKKASAAKNLVKTGGDGSVVTMADGSTFVYNNTYGGFWVDDPKNPWNNSARPNSWTKPLTEKWDFVNDQINGVNLGGWFVLEPFITPEFYQRYNGSLDEWTLSEMMAKDTANGGLDQIEKHYATFITEKDIAQIAGAGLNWVRLPIPYWAIDKWGDEPFLAQKAWPYIVQALKWCRKYGLRVNLDLHTIPGSQNGYNHSGRLGPNPNWMYGIMGLANAQRSLDYMRTIVEFISQPEYVNVVQIFSPVNEALLLDIGIDMLARL
jgi:glucan 1,3-beta-glucosidase